MFRAVAIIALVVTFVGIGIHCVLFPTSRQRRCVFGCLLRGLVGLVMLLFVEQKLSPLGVLKKLVYLLALLCFAVLAITGFYPLLVLDKHITGYFVMVHATFAPIFAICLAVLAVMWARGHRFIGGDWPLLQRVLERVTLQKSPPPPNVLSGASFGGPEQMLSRSPSLWQKITFWALIFLALPLILSIVSSMFPLCGTYWQEVLLAAHRWTALVFAVVAIVHIYIVIRAKMV
jgi:cytochrome b subunit of formate dehydrogenase